MDTACKTKDLSQQSFSKTVNGGTVCRKAARTGLWGSREVTNCSTRNQEKDDLKHIYSLKSFFADYLLNAVKRQSHL